MSDVALAVRIFADVLFTLIGFVGFAIVKALAGWFRRELRRNKGNP